VAAEFEARFPVSAPGGSWLTVESFDCFEDGEGKVFEGVILWDRLSIAPLRVWMEHRLAQIELEAGAESRLLPFCRANVRQARTRCCFQGEGRPQPSSLEEVLDMGPRGRALLPAPVQAAEAQPLTPTEQMSDNDNEFAEEAGVSEVAGRPALAPAVGDAPAEERTPGNTTATARGAAPAQTAAPIWERFQHSFSQAKAAAAERPKRTPGNAIANEFWAEMDELMAESAVVDLAFAIGRSAGPSGQRSVRCQCAAIHVLSPVGCAGIAVGINFTLWPCPLSFASQLSHQPNAGRPLHPMAGGSWRLLLLASLGAPGKEIIERQQPEPAAKGRRGEAFCGLFAATRPPHCSHQEA